MSENRVIDNIKSGKTKMRPRRYFLALRILQIVVIAVILALLLYVASFILFVIHQNGTALGVYFGLAGWLVFIRSLPWISVLLLILLILVLALLMRRYRVVYHQPLFYLLFIIILFLGCGSFIIAATSFNSSFLGYLETNTSLFGSFYQYEETPSNGVYHGEIVSFTPGGFILLNTGGIATSSVLWPPGVSSQFIATLKTGDQVVVFGGRDAEGTIVSFGIDKTL